MKKLLTRTITGCIYVALIVFSLIYPDSTPFLILFSLLTVLGLYEFYHLVDNNGEKKKITLYLDIIGGVILFGSIYWQQNVPEAEAVWFAPYLLYFLTRMVIQLYSVESNAITHLAHSFMGQVYVALPLALLNIIYASYGERMLLALFIFIWLNDTGAFCIGSLLGKHRLFERISPKKSWEGFWGGLSLCILASLAFYLFANEFFRGPSLWAWIGFAITVSVFATWGDLCESLIKRTLKVKDSGKILPGHGGILDRIDSLLVVSPAVLLYFIIIYSFLSM